MLLLLLLLLVMAAGVAHRALVACPELTACMAPTFCLAASAQNARWAVTSVEGLEPLPTPTHASNRWNAVTALQAGRRTIPKMHAGRGWNY